MFSFVLNRPMNVMVDLPVGGMVDILFELLPWFLAAVLVLGLLTEVFR